jgi:hypothetical protein
MVVVRMQTAEEQLQLQNELELDVIGEEDKIALVSTVAQSVAATKHANTPAVEARSEKIEEDWDVLKAAVAARSVRAMALRTLLLLMLV